MKFKIGALSILFCSIPAMAQIPSGLKLGVFLEPQFLVTNKDEVPTRGFTLNDGALYLSKDFGQGVVASLDLPFATPDSSTTNAVGFGNNKAQAFLRFTRDHVVGDFGQFDTTFGFESNDSKDRFFADKGWLSEHVTPVTHSGLMVGYDNGEVVFRGLVANPTNSGTMANQNPEFGFQFGFKKNDAYGTAGILANEAKTGANKTNMLFNVMGGAKLGSLKIDGEYDNKRTAGYDKTANCFGIYASYEIDPLLSWGGRFEFLKDAVATVLGTTSLTDQVVGGSFGPSYKLTSEVTARGDVSIASVKIPSASDVNLFGVSGSIVASF